MLKKGTAPFFTWKKLKKRALSPFFAVFVLLSFSSVSVADMLRTETKRERLKRERAEQASRPSGNAHALYEKIYENFLKQDYPAVNELADRYRALGIKTGEEPGDVLYLQALSLIKMGRSDEGRQKLRELGSVEASVSIGDSYFYEGDYEAARREYEATLKKHPAAENADYVQEKLRGLGASSSSAPAALTAPARLQQIATEEMPFFSIQVGAFSKEKNALQLRDKLIPRYEANVLEGPNENQWRVRVGKFATREEALQVEAQLEKEGHPTRIVP